MTTKTSSHKTLIRLAETEGRGWKCEYCESDVACCCPKCVPDKLLCRYLRREHNTHVASIDHIIPQFQAGKREGNLAIACLRCNGLKSNLIIEQPITLSAILLAVADKKRKDDIHYAELRRIAAQKKAARAEKVFA